MSSSLLPGFGTCDSEMERSFAEFLPGLAEALERGGNTHSLEDVLYQIMSGDAQIWTNESACIVTEVLQFPEKRVLHFWLATGEFEAVRRLGNEVVIPWGRSVGCDHATITGRKGWERALREEGWSLVSVQLLKRI